MFKKVGDANGTGVFQKQAQQVGKQVIGQVPPNNHVQTPGVNQVVETKLVPIQITLPAQPGSDLGPRVLSIQVPTTALQGNQLHKVLTGPVISATMGLPQAIANNLLQQHVNAAFGGSSHTLTIAPQIITKPVIQGDAALTVDSSDEEVELPKFTIEPGCSAAKAGGSKTKRKKQPEIVICLKQHDGSNDTSDEEEEGSDDDEDSDDAEDDRDEDEQEMEDAGPEEEPLNSEDDVTDEDPGDLFDTENVVVCQYDKVICVSGSHQACYFMSRFFLQISRTRNKWKFHLKDGIMNMNGEDYLFQRANGDAEW